MPHSKKPTIHKTKFLSAVPFVEYLGLRRARRERNARKSARRHRGRVADEGERYVHSRATRRVHTLHRRYRRR